MAFLNVPTKEEGQLLQAGEVNQIVTAINTVNDEALAVSHAFADTDFVEDGTAVVDGVAVPLIKVNPVLFTTIPSNETRDTLLAKLQVIPAENLPPVYFEGFTGSGTSDDPYLAPEADSGSFEAYLQGLPGYTSGTDKMLIGGNGFSWTDIPTGASNGTLPTPTLTFGTVASTSATLNWTASANATGYQLQRDTTSAFSSPVGVFTGNALTFTDTGLSVTTHYYYRVRATAPSYTSSAFGLNDTTTTANDDLSLVPVQDLKGTSFPNGNWIESEGYAVIGNSLQAPDSNNLNRSRSNAYIPAGAIGSIQSTGYGRIALDDTPTELSYGPSFNYCVNINSANFKISTQVGTVQTQGNVIAGVTSGVTVRIRATATTIVFGYRLAGSSTWVEPTTVARTAGVDLYVKADEGYDRTDQVNNILGGGLSFNTSLV